MSEPKKIVITGAGLSGLATAYYLEKIAGERNFPIEVTLLEASSRVGGKITTFNSEDFLIEGGPESFLNDKPAGLELCKELGLEDQFVPMNTEHRSFYVCHKGRLVRFPVDMRLFVPQSATALLKTSLLSAGGKLRAAMEPFIKAKKDGQDESMWSFVSRRFGDELTQTMAGPIMAGIFAGDPKKLSIQATWPMFAQMEQKSGSLTRAIQKVKRKTTGVSPFTALKDGMETLTKRLEEKLDAKIKTSMKAKLLEIRGPQFSIVAQNAQGNPESLGADAVILATPANHSAPLLERSYPQLASKLNSLSFGSSVSISLGYLKEDAFRLKELHGSGFMWAYGEERELIGCSWPTNKFDGRSSDKHFLIRAFMGGEDHPKWNEQSDAELISHVRGVYKKLLGIEGKPVITNVTRWVNANPQYEVGHKDRIEDIDRITAQIPGLYLTGSSYHGVSMPDIIKDARRTAEETLNSF